MLSFNLTPPPAVSRSTGMGSCSNVRILKEISDIQKGSDLSLAVAFRDANVRHVRALIVGPADTPYEFGFFGFDVKFPSDYPTTSPAVKSITTDYGSTRFNPNIYADGKVCLSILGTWRGEPGENWSSVQCLESVLLSIQSLMSSNPWENEPGFENTPNSGRADAGEAEQYAAKIRHETIRITVLKRLEEVLNIDGPARSEDAKSVLSWGQDPPTADTFDASRWDPFADICKRRFLWYYNSYLASIEAERKQHDKNVADGKIFTKTPFEFLGNSMSGIFEYTKLETRLRVVFDTINSETEQWIVNGAKALARESPVALCFQNTFKALVQKFKDSDTPLDIDLIDDNPFAWRLVMFGRPMTNLDGGIFKIRLVFSIDFPEEQPRVKVETPLFHHRVSSDGELCYFPKKHAEVGSHIQAIIAAIDDAEPRYDPRAVVNREATKLLWGTPDEKKVYNRKLRRSAQDSSE